MDTVELHAPPAAAPPISAKAAMLSPVLAALCYPFLLRAFHAAVVSSVDQASAAVTPLAVACLLGALATPLLGLAVAFRLSRDDRPSRFVLRARRLAYASIATPPMFVFAGVALGLLHSSIRDTSAWVAGWLATLAYGWSARDSEVPASASTVARLRVAHGVSAVLLAAFVLFHLSNHLTGLLGPAAHARVMEIGRTVYRSTWSEPVFIAFLLFQGRERASPRLALERAPRRPLSHRPGRIRRVSRGLHRHPPELGADLRAHGPRRRDGLGLGLRRAPEGLILDAWNIRLLPHYTFGVFFVLAHLATGLRHVPPRPRPERDDGEPVLVGGPGRQRSRGRNDRRRAARLAALSRPVGRTDGAGSGCWMSGHRQASSTKSMVRIGSHLYALTHRLR